MDYPSQFERNIITHLYFEDTDAYDKFKIKDNKCIINKLSDFQIL